MVAEAHGFSELTNELQARHAFLREAIGEFTLWQRELRSISRPVSEGSPGSDMGAYNRPTRELMPCGDTGAPTQDTHVEFRHCRQGEAVARIRNDEQYELQKARILTAAAKVFQAKGYQAATMDDLAKAVGMTKAAVYYYYPKKNDILLEICQSAVDGALDRIREVNRSEASAAERLREMIAGNVDTLTSNIEAWAVFYQEMALRRDPQARKIVAGLTEFSTSIETVIAEGVETGEFRDVDTHLVTLAVFGMCNWMYRWYRAEGRTPTEIVEEFVEFILAGLRAETPMPRQQLPRPGR